MQKRKTPPSAPPDPGPGPGSEDYLSPAPGGDGIYLKVIIRPGASKEMVVSPYQGGLKVKVNAPPVEGAANKNLIAMISKVLHVPKTSIEIKQGLASKHKLLRIKGIYPNEAQGHVDAAIVKNNK